MPATTTTSSGPRAFPRIKAVWGTAGIHAHWRLGLFGFYERVHGFPRSGLAISGRGLLAWSAGLLLLAYFGAAGVATQWFRRNPYNKIQFSDVLTWPVHRQQVARLRAEAWLAEGKAAMKRGRWGEGTFYLRHGLDVVPEDFESRALLAEFYVAVGDRARGLSLIEAGLKYGLVAQSGLQPALNVAVAGEEWQVALRLCDRALEQYREAGKWTDGQWLLSRKLAILTRTGRAAEALPLAEAEGDDAMILVKLEHARALVALGRAPAAADLISRWRQAPGSRDQRELLTEFVNVLRESGRFEEMDQALAELRSLFSDRPEALALAVIQRATAHRAAAAALEDYIFRFGADAANLMLVAPALAAIPDFPLLQRVVGAAQERGFDSRPFRMFVAEARLRAGDTPGFLRETAEIQKLPDVPARDATIWLQWTKTLADALTSPQSGAADSLVVFLRGNPLALDAHRLTVAALRRAGKLEAARDVLLLSRRLYAESVDLAVQQKDVKGALALAAAATAAATVAPAAVAVANDWNEFVGPVDAAIAGANWGEARRLIRQLRQSTPVPDWLAAHDAELVWRELRTAQALKDSLALQIATRAYVTGSAVRAHEILALAREWQAAGAINDATFVVRAVLEKSPDHGVAKKQLQSLQGPGKASGEK